VLKQTFHFQLDLADSPHKRSMKKPSKKQTKELAALAKLPDRKINLSDAPELPDWSRAVIGKFYRPIKRPVTVRIDADILAWLKRSGPGYQTRINALLRQAMHPTQRPNRKKSRA
jgi:uncharacterized protein (DUF4415 family)